MRAWHTLPKQELYKLLETGDHGLQKQEAAKRFAEYGPNELDFAGKSLLKKIIEPFASIFVAVLAAAALISLFTHEQLNAVIIGAVLVINACVFWVQEYTTSRVLRALRRTAEQHVTVVRGGKHIEIPARELVPGDILLLGEGQQVPADARVLHDDNMQIDESALTGESLPLEKQAGVLPDETPLYGRRNMVFRGTYVISGTAELLVVETGMQTEFGAIAHLAAQRDVKSPVREKIDRTISILIRVTGVVALLVFFLTWLRGISFEEGLIFAMTVGVSMVPEGLPIALTVTVVFGMRHMAKKNALVRSFRAIEDIGLLTTIATDKTGTLTKNKLSVVDTWELESKDPTLPVLAKAIGDTEGISDPLDKAFAEFVAKKKQRSTGLLLQTFPFEQAIRMSGAAWASGKGAKDIVLSIKGAPEHIIRQSKLTTEQKHTVESKLHQYAANGYRVIGVATLKVSKYTEKLEETIPGKLDFVGFVACADELRPEAKGAIAEAHKAGIRVCLITGDHYETAFNIAHTLNLAESRSQVISGHDLPEDDDKLIEVVKDKTVFARVLPDDKFRILKALQANGVVSMTGDGVNDVPALSNAHVGVAMGSGSDIAKDAADMVLLDNNFATIIKGIAEGRKTYNNIRRMLFYLLATTLGEVLTMIAALLIGLPLPVTAVMILWVNLVTDTALVIPLGLEPAEGDEMTYPPRKPGSPILTPAYLVRIVIVGVIMAGGTLGSFAWLLHEGYSEAYAMTIAFMTLIVVQWANALNARSNRQSLFKRIRVRNTPMVIGLTLAITLQMLVMFGPLGGLFGIEPVAIKHILISGITIVIAVIGAVEIQKYFLRRTHLRRTGRSIN